MPDLDLSCQIKKKNYAMQKFCKFSNFAEPCNHKKEGRVRRLFLFSSLKKNWVRDKYGFQQGHFN